MLGRSFPGEPIDRVGAASAAKQAVDQIAGMVSDSLQPASRLMPLPQGNDGAPRRSMVALDSRDPQFLICHCLLLPMEGEHKPASIPQGANGDGYASSAKRG